MVLSLTTTYKLCGVVCNREQYGNPANTGYSPNAVSMLGQRRRRWANIETALGEFPMFDGNHLSVILTD